MRARGLRLLLAAALSFFAPGRMEAAIQLEPVTLQLKWKHAFQFAGYYAAHEQGYYREAGLDVRFLEAKPGMDPVQVVLAGGAQFGVGTSSLLRNRAAGAPVVALAVLFQHSPYIFLVRADSGIQHVRDLAERRVVLEPQADELKAYMRREGLDPGRLKLLEHHQTVDHLISQTVDAMTAYTTDEPDLMEQRGIPYRAFSPRDAGIDFYGDNLFTTEHEVKRHPERTKAFREASLRGWSYALQHPEAMVELILAKYAPKGSREHLRFEAAQTLALIRPDLVDVGYMSGTRWRHIAEVYGELGMMPQGYSMEGFLYQSPTPLDWYQVMRLLALPLLTCMAAILVAVYFFRRTRALREGAWRQGLLTNHVDDVLWATDLEGRFTFVSPSVERLCGYTPAEVLHQRLEDALSSDASDRATQELRAALQAVQEGSTIPHFRGELAQRCKDGSTVWTELRASGLRDGAGRCLGLVGVSRDITERRRFQEALQHQASTDTVTGTWNRRHVEELGQGELQRYIRYGHALSLLFVDLDRFKAVNDRFGHRAGDEVLRGFCVAVQKCLRTTDILGRWGGDEFLVLAPGTGLASAMLLGERIRRAVEAHAYGAAGTITVSVGVTECRLGDDWDALVERADRALYRAKGAGKNDVECVSDFALEPPTSFLRLEWNSSYASGQPQIDAQHIELFHRANDVLQLVLLGAEPGVISNRLEELVEHVELHFDTEIAILRATGYDAVDAHADRHRELSEHARLALVQSRRGEVSQRDLLAFLVCDVVAQHMLHEDACFFPLFR